MIAQARTELPNECCGLLAGRIENGANGEKLGRVVCAYPLVNEARTPTRYMSEAKSLFAAEIERRSRGLEFLAIYHSHPTSEPVPSRTDLEQNNYGDSVVHFIVSLASNEPRVRAWRLAADEFHEAEWAVE